MDEINAGILADRLTGDGFAARPDNTGGGWYNVVLDSPTHTVAIDREGPSEPYRVAWYPDTAWTDGGPADAYAEPRSYRALRAAIARPRPSRPQDGGGDAPALYTLRDTRCGHAVGAGGKDTLERLAEKFRAKRGDHYEVTARPPRITRSGVIHLDGCETCRDLPRPAGQGSRR